MTRIQDGEIAAGVDVGFQACTDPGDNTSCRNDCWIQTTNDIPLLSPSNRGSVVSLASNGRSFAMSEPTIDKVRIFDLDINKWRQRGETLTGIAGTSFGSVMTLLGTPGNVVSQRIGRLPLILSIASIANQFDIKIYIWTANDSEWRVIGNINSCPTESGPGNCAVSSIASARLSSGAVVLAVEVSAQSVAVYESNENFSVWEEQIVLGGRNPSLSANGEVLVISTSKTFDIARRSSGWGIEISIDVDGDIQAIAIDSFGSNINVACSVNNLDGTVRRFSNDEAEFGWESVGQPLSLSLARNPVFVFSPNGEAFIAKTVGNGNNDNELESYRWDVENMGWFEMRYDVQGGISGLGSVGLSYDGNMLIQAGARHAPTTPYELSPFCSDDYRTVRLSIATDNNPNFISWSIERIGEGSNEPTTYRSCQNCYNNGTHAVSNIVENFCLPRDGCFHFELRSRGGGMCCGGGFVLLEDGVEKASGAGSPSGSGFALGHTFQNEENSCPSVGLRSFGGGGLFVGQGDGGS